MKSSKLWIWLLIGAVVLIVIIALFFQNNHTTQDNNPQMQNTTNTQADTQTNTTTLQADRTSGTTQVKGVFHETQLSVFSTPLLSKASGRLHNIHITCDKLENYIIPNGKTFSFNQVVGEPTATEGYEEADVIIHGEVEKDIGGGNCQVSSTIYNAALLVEGIEILERHEHGKDVSYVAEGKDAAVSYGSLDFKFINKTGKDIKLHVGTDDVYVTAQIVSIS